MVFLGYGSPSGSAEVCGTDKTEVRFRLNNFIPPDCREIQLFGSQQLD